MIPQCPRCRINVACKDHPTSLFAWSSQIGTTGREPEVAKLLPTAFRFVETAQPKVKAHASTTIAPQDVQKRKLGDIVDSEVPLKRACISERLGLHSNMGRTLRSCAYDCWQSVQGCDSDRIPEGLDIQQTVLLDAQYQRSKPLEEFRMPSGARLRCIHCLRDKGEWKTWSRDSGTTRIREHMLKKHPDDFHARPAILTHLADQIDEEELLYTPELLTESIAEWIAHDDQAFNVVESQEFRRIILIASRAPPLQDKDIPGRKKMVKTVHELYLEQAERIRQEIWRSRGRISITSDLWSDEILRAFMAVTAHYINEAGRLTEHLLAFRRVNGSHTGANVGKSLFSVFVEFGITEKIGHITLDNASPNDTLMKELQTVLTEKEIPFGHDINRIRCYAHIINLVVVAMLKELPAAAQMFREEAAAKGDDLDNDICAYLGALESGVVGDCRASIRSLRSSDVRREGFMKCIKEGNLLGIFRTAAGSAVTLPVLQLLRDSETRWSLTYNMIVRYIELYPAICYYTSSQAEKDIPVLSEVQLDVLQDVASVLSVLHHAQELLSAERTPTLALALPVYESIVEALKGLTFEYPVLRHSIESGIRKLEGYIAKTRDLPVYTLAMVVNPCIKFSWIDQNWSALRRQSSRVLVREEMLKFCEKLADSRRYFTQSTSTGADRAAKAQHSGYLRLLSTTNNARRACSSTAGPSKLSTVAPSPLPTPEPPSAEELLIRYMAEVDAELARWEQLEGFDDESMGSLNLYGQARRYEFPLLYEIAMNVLPVQASSVSSERVFSSSKLTCTRERTRISPENMEYLQVLKHAVHRRSSRSQENNQTLDFIEKMTYLDLEDKDKELYGLY
ncbi:hAT family dimerization protein [Ceratobasidium sp. AG-Ba]|nr:hAT family dimerization protein [Ceratobasidium sp. AG-Ba]